MAELIRVPLEADGSLIVEVDSRDGGVVKAARPGQIVADATQTLEAALASLVPGAIAVVEKLRAAKPSELSLSFGIKLTAEAGAVIAKTAGECNFAVTLHWQENRNTDA